MLKQTTRALLWTAGIISLGIGITGLLVPMLPGFPFLLIATYCFAKSDERMHRWLINHKIFGKAICDWKDHGIIRKRAKITAIAMIAAGAPFPLYFVDGIPIAVRIVTGVTLAAVILFIATRPSTT